MEWKWEINSPCGGMWGGESSISGAAKPGFDETRWKSSCFLQASSTQFPSRGSLWEEARIERVALRINRTGSHGTAALRFYSRGSVSSRRAAREMMEAPSCNLGHRKEGALYIEFLICVITLLARDKHVPSLLSSSILPKPSVRRAGWESDGSMSSRPTISIHSV